ncbi:MAG: mucoidy inhibitor MuiA family protein [Candidatus Omnitrophica bacterium]|nr:mucoidy inhibitor MuiA family protein [Candidatus Omnitrophota bacterium]MDD5573738.1 mucoidy inhibitor MuiA family protein [Candidatus Omnitrophota bacterium]
MKRGMKLFFIVALSLVAAYPVFAKDIDSHISQVVVYPDSALITRVGTMDLAAGEHEIVFADIIPDIDEGSLRVSGEGTATVKILGAQVKKEFLQEAAGERVKELELEIQAQLDEIGKIEDAQRVAGHKKQLLDALLNFSGEQVPQDMATRMPQAKELGDLLNFLDMSYKDHYAVLQALGIKERDARKKLDVLQKELGQISRSHKMKRSIAVDVEAVKGGSLTLEVSYLARGASWYPVYEARTVFDKSQVELVGFGVVRQRTGEDWKEVDVTLSTARPTVSGQMPDLVPWFLQPYEPPQVRRKGLFAEKSQAMSREADYEPYYMKDENMTLAGSAAPEQVEEARMEYAAVEEKGVSVVYKITRKATIKADGSEERLPVLSQNLDAKFQYSAYPRASTFAYLTARVTNQKDLQLLPGRMNIFLEGDFVGISQLAGIAPSEEFDLYLGIDENVKVKKEELERKVDEVLLGGIPSPTRKVTILFKTTVENYKNKDITFELFDSLPVSQDDRIKVRVERVSLEPKEKDYKDKKGVWRWELKLKPREKVEIAYTAIVEYPRNLRVEGM